MKKLNDTKTRLQPHSLTNLHAKLRREQTGRLASIHDEIQCGAYPNCHTLATRFEVSLKTIKRDLAFMRGNLRLPIEYNRLRRGFFYSGPVKRFPGVPAAVSEADLFSMLVADKAIAQFRGTPFQQPLKKSFQRLIAQLDTTERYSVDDLQAALSIRPFAPEDTDVRTFRIITRALKEHRVLVFQYRKPGTRTAERRRVHPYHVTYIENRWYLMGHDTARDATRTFALSRLSAPCLADQRFLKPLVFSPEKYLGGSLSVMKGDGDYEIVIELDPWATDIVRGRQWHASQKITELPAGGCHLSLHLSGLEEIEQLVLSWGIHATVIRPEVLADRIRRIATTLVQRYAPRSA